MSRNKLKKHEESIYMAAFSAAGSGVPGAFMPGLDVATMAGIWATMLLVISDNAGRELDKNTALKIVKSIIAGSAAYLGGSKLFTYTLHIIPGIGTLGVVGLNSLFNFLYTIRLGNFIAIQMEKTDFDTDDFSTLIPDITAIVFSAPSASELKEAWQDYNNNKNS